ncbi:peptidoglycan-binding protein [Streptomyces sp. McG3]|uniref:peptidoglycan-binding domain-containing protein n=1 Tax=Streptomyces sp. McG3 TaxID=2725483 RepID=UPI001BEA4705|nr:peptidoglycan-binding domain-containing protein [Streptomyces sp. McG3]MBT2897199.1 peptidoglycan-binding protein [Streptomyces sp. McG3]
MELQLRLAQIGAYEGEADGVYDEQVTIAVEVYQWWAGASVDRLGVYGPHTRSLLEAETGEPE